MASNGHQSKTATISLGNVTIDKYDSGTIYEYGDDYGKKPHGDK
jgi:hypothetical protein